MAFFSPMVEKVFKKQFLRHSLFISIPKPDKPELKRFVAKAPSSQRKIIYNKFPVVFVQEIEPRIGRIVLLPSKRCCNR